MRHERLRDEDDELLQFAIQQSLMEAGTENDQVLNRKLKFVSDFCPPPPQKKKIEVRFFYSLWCAIQQNLRM